MAAMDSSTKKVTVYIRLLNEGTEVMRPTESLDLGEGLFELLPTGDYDPADEHWEFTPGTVVRCERVSEPGGEYLRAITRVR